MTIDEIRKLPGGFKHDTYMRNVEELFKPLAKTVFLEYYEIIRTNKKESFMGKKICVRDTKGNVIPPDENGNQNKWTGPYQANAWNKFRKIFTDDKQYSPEVTLFFLKNCNRIPEEHIQLAEKLSTDPKNYYGTK